jgi:hypothetical protein
VFAAELTAAEADANGGVKSLGSHKDPGCSSTQAAARRNLLGPSCRKSPSSPKWLYKAVKSPSPVDVMILLDQLGRTS